MRESPLRVALLSTSGLSSKGSMRAYADTLMNALARHGTGLSAELVELDPEPEAGSLRRRLRALGLPWRAWRHRSRAPDVWHVLDGSHAYAAAMLPRSSLVVTVHDIIPWLQDQGRFEGVPGLGRAARALWRQNARVMRSAAALVCDSANSASDATSAFGFTAERCRVVPLPLRRSIESEVGVVSGVRDSGLVMHVGNGAFYKNREGALRVFAACRRDLAQRLVMAGPAPSRQLLALASELGVAEQVQWVRDPDDAHLVAAYRRAAVLLFPSRYEGFGWPVLEAMALGLPVVASRAGSLPEVAGEAAAYEPDDVPGMAAAVERVLASTAWADEVAERGRRQAAEFRAETFATQMQATYHAVAMANRSKETQ